MYAWLWRALPGPVVVRLVLVLVLLLAMFALLMVVVFPAVEPLLPFNDVSVGHQ